MNNDLINVLRVRLAPEGTAPNSDADQLIQNEILHTVDLYENLAIDHKDSFLPLSVSGSIFLRAAAIRGLDGMQFHNLIGQISAAYIAYCQAIDERDRTPGNTTSGIAGTIPARPPE